MNLDEFMIKEYNMLNDVKAMRLIDDIKTYLGRHDWLDAIMDKGGSFPIEVTLSGGVNSMRIDNILNIIHNGKLKSLGRRNLSRKRLIPFLEEFDASSYTLAKDFFTFYKKCFGEPFKENWLYKNIVCFSIMRIWLANRDLYKEEEMIKAFSPIAKNQTLRLTSNYRGDLEIKNFILNLYQVINYRRSANKFAIFWDEEMII